MRTSFCCGREQERIVQLVRLGYDSVIHCAENRPEGSLPRMNRNNILAAVEVCL